MKLKFRKDFTLYGGITESKSEFRRFYSGDEFSNVKVELCPNEKHVNITFADGWTALQCSKSIFDLYSRD